MPRLIAEGYRLETDTASQLTFSRSHRPAWTIALAVFAFPVGLLALAYEDRCQVAISFDEGDDETLVTVSGTAPLGIRRAVRCLALEDE